MRPVLQLARNIAAFADDPERFDRPAACSRRTDEIGQAETALARMKAALGGELRQKRRLAELGLSVSKINHELRNLLTTAQLLGDRFETVSDPVVQRVAPRLVATLDRAIRFCEATLAYGRATEPNAQRRMVALAPLLDELTDLSGLMPAAGVEVSVCAPADLEIDADPEQLLRALTNLVRNAVQAHAAARTTGASVVIEGLRDGSRGAGQVTILVSITVPRATPRAGQPVRRLPGLDPPRRHRPRPRHRFGTGAPQRRDAGPRRDRQRRLLPHRHPGSGDPGEAA